MRYHLTDDEADPSKLLGARQYSHHLAEVQGAEDGGARAVLQDFVNAFRPRYLERLRELTAQGVGYGVEIAGSTYDDDLEPGDEPFEGVLVKATFRGDEVVLSREAFQRLVDAMVALAPPQG